MPGLQPFVFCVTVPALQSAMGCWEHTRSIGGKSRRCHPATALVSLQVEAHERALSKLIGARISGSSRLDGARLGMPADLFAENRK